MKLRCYKTMPEWSAKTLPKGFQNKHNTQEGTWAKLVIRSGQLRYDALDEQGSCLETKIFDKDSEIPFIEPQAWHRVQALSEDLQVQLSFYCRPEDYYKKKYGLTQTHSSVIDALNYVSRGRALDVGCGRGRNALFLRQAGFSVDAFDPKVEAINRLHEIIESERITKLHAFVAQAQDLTLTEQYDLVINTVVMMFIPPEHIKGIIETMQNATKPGGCNLIVCAMNTKPHPYEQYTLPFKFGFKENELVEYYKGWTIEHYDENLGHLHRMDAKGNPIGLQFATLIARKGSIS